MRDSQSKRTWHSKHYHRYFQGYTEYRVSIGGGRTRIKRVYTGDYLIQDIPDRQWIRNRIHYSGLYLIALAAFLWSASRPVGSNSAWYAALPCALAVSAMFVLLLILIAYVASPRRMTFWQHSRGTARLKPLSLFAAAALALNALAVLAFLLLHRGRLSLELPVLTGYLTSGAAVVAVNRLENRMPYRREPSGSEVRKGETGFPIGEERDENAV